MELTLVSLLCIVGLFIFMMLGVPIVFSLGFCAVLGGIVALGSSCLPKVGWTPFHMLFNLAWTPLPLFVFLGSLISQTDMGRDLFKAASNWLGRVPGGLIVSGIFGEAAMAATLGTSAACIVVVGKVAVPEFERYGYNRSLSLGALLAGGALGPLIPPSATFIIISVLADLSLGKLFIAGVIPGIILAIMLAIPAVLICSLRPQLAPRGERVSWLERFYSLRKVWPVAVVIISILGAIYMGVATPTESAGVGCVIVLIIAVAFFGLRWQGLRQAMVEAAVINAMILFILVGASFFTYVVGSSNIAQHLLTVIGSSEIAPWLVIITINVILLFLGCILEPLTITLLTIPIFIPIIESLGFEPLWFAVVFSVNTQIGLITPPMGIDLFAVKTIFNIPTGDILRGVTPFLLMTLVFLAVITAFPILSLWLPGMMVSR
jgi:tripartite ATP-independent transporter DctM subunit